MVSTQKALETKLLPSVDTFSVARTDSTTTTLTFSEGSLSPAEHSPKARKTKQKGVSLHGNQRTDTSQRNSKTCAKFTKINHSRASELLKKYYDKNIIFRNEEFSQQACSFIAKIASDEEIPKEIKGNSSLYYIFVSIAKIFMLNEYELAILACSLDQCDWNIKDIIREDEESFLKEFPCSLEVEITKDSRRLIIYLLMLTYFLKSNLNDKNEMELIQAYCEKICKNFLDLLKRASKAFKNQKFHFTPSEINKKFCYLSKKDNKEPFMKILKDYNMVVESILRLTGSHSIKPKVKTSSLQKFNTKEKVKANDDSVESVFTDSNHDTDVFYAKLNTYVDSNDIAQFSHKPSTINHEDSINCKREADTETYPEENIIKKVKYNDESFFIPPKHPERDCFKSASIDAFIEVTKRYDTEDYFDMLDLSMKPLTTNQIQDEVSLFSKFNCNSTLPAM